MHLHVASQERLGLAPIWGNFWNKILDCGTTAQITGDTLIAVSYINSAVISYRLP